MDQLLQKQSIETPQHYEHFNHILYTTSTHKELLFKYFEISQENIY